MADSSTRVRCRGIALTNQRVLQSRLPVLLVSHDEDSGWQFHSGGGFPPKDGRFVWIDDLFELDPTLRKVADLPVGWWACRPGPTAPWHRAPQERWGENPFGSRP